MKPQVRQDLPAEVMAALAPLWKAWACARDLKLDPWEIALRLLQLEKLGASESNLRWLVLNGYVDHADEVTTFHDPARRFRPRVNVSFTGETCFVLSEKGALVAGHGRKTTHLTPPPIPRFSRNHLVSFPVARLGSQTPRTLA